MASSLIPSKTIGHSAANPGLRGHSCGDLYPWLIVGIGGHPHTVWQVRHAITGETLKSIRYAGEYLRAGNYECFRSLRKAERAAFLAKKTEV
jgi:hypothetical protein